MTADSRSGMAHKDNKHTRRCDCTSWVLHDDRRYRCGMFGELGPACGHNDDGSNAAEDDQEYDNDGGSSGGGLGEENDDGDEIDGYGKVRDVHWFPARPAMTVEGKPQDQGRQNIPFANQVEHVNQRRTSEWHLTKDMPQYPHGTRRPEG
jgi:hypothetical protein